MLTPKHKATKLGIAPRSQSYQRSAEVADDLNVGGTSSFSKTEPRILTPCHPLFVPGYYYASPLISFSPSDLSWDDFFVDTIYVFAYPVPRQIVASKIAIEIGGASGTAGSTLSMVLYDAFKDYTMSEQGTTKYGLPHNLVRNFGTVATDSTGVKVIDFSDNKLTLPADLYWLGLNNSHGLVDIIGGKASMGIYGYSDRPVNASGFYQSTIYGTWPNPFDLSLTRTAHKIGLRFGFWVYSLGE